MPIHECDPIPTHLSRFAPAAGLLALTAALASCDVHDPGSPEADLAVEHSQLYVGNGITLWNGATSTNRGPLGTSAVIPVCFTVRPRPQEPLACSGANAFFDCSRIASKPDPLIPGANVTLDQNVLRPFLKNVMQKTWGRAANIEFVGWGDCPIDAASGQHKNSQLTRTIVIQFRDADIANLGRSTTAPTVVQYNWVWLMKAATTNPDLSLFNVVHEFGHALGFPHEWQRQDWPDGSCPWLNGANAQINSALAGKCLDVFQSGTANGTKVDISTCGSATGQKWTWGTLSSGALDGSLRALGKCLDVASGGVANGSKAEIRACDGRASQRWVGGANGSIRNVNSGRCLDVPNASTTNGTQLQLLDCNGAASQRWNVAPGDTSLTLPDPVSIMNYCPGPANSGTLSAWDIIGVQRAYGRKSKGSLVDGGGLCANVSGGNTAIGTPIIAYPCRNQANDLWLKDDTSQRFQANLSSSVQRCLNVSGGVVGPNPTPVGTWVCQAATNEDFPLADMEWRGMGNMCATAGASTINMQPCNPANDAQKWTFLDGDPGTPLRFDQIRLKNSNLCVSTTTNTGTLGESLVLRTCSTTDTKQRFNYPGQGIIGFGGFCMNISGGTTTSGSPIGLWDGCNGTPRPYNSQFSLSGNVKSLGQCLDSSVPTQVSVKACDTVPTNAKQIWEYYL